MRQDTPTPHLQALEGLDALHKQRQLPSRLAMDHGHTEGGEGNQLLATGAQRPRVHNVDRLQISSEGFRFEVKGAPCRPPAAAVQAARQDGGTVRLHSGAQGGQARGHRAWQATACRGSSGSGLPRRQAAAPRGSDLRVRDDEPRALVLQQRAQRPQEAAALGIDACWVGAARCVQVHAVREGTAVVLDDLLLHQCLRRGSGKGIMGTKGVGGTACSLANCSTA